MASIDSWSTTLGEEVEVCGRLEEDFLGAFRGSCESLVGRFDGPADAIGRDGR